MQCSNFRSVRVAYDHALVVMVDCFHRSASLLRLRVSFKWTTGEPELLPRSFVRQALMASNVGAQIMGAQMNFWTCVFGSATTIGRVQLDLQRAHDLMPRHLGAAGRSCG